MFWVQPGSVGLVSPRCRAELMLVPEEEEEEEEVTLS